jgi:hypothetical protein
MTEQREFILCTAVNGIMGKQFGDVPVCIAVSMSFQDHIVNNLQPNDLVTFATFGCHEIEGQLRYQCLQIEKTQFSTHADLITTIILSEMEASFKISTQRESTTLLGLQAAIRNTRGGKNKHIILVTPGISDPRLDRQSKRTIFMELRNFLEQGGKLSVIYFDKDADTFSDFEPQQGFSTCLCEVDPSAIYTKFADLWHTSAPGVNAPQRSSVQGIALEEEDAPFNFEETLKELHAEMENQEQPQPIQIKQEQPIVPFFAPQSRKDTPYDPSQFQRWKNFQEPRVAPVPQPVSVYPVIRSLNKSSLAKNSSIVLRTILDILRSAPGGRMSLSTLGHEFKTLDPEGKSIKERCGMKMKDFFAQHKDKFEVVLEEIKLTDRYNTGMIPKPVPSRPAQATLAVQSTPAPIGFINNSAPAPVDDKDIDIVKAMDLIEEMIRDMSMSIVSGIAIDFVTVCTLINREREQLLEYKPVNSIVQEMQQSLKARIDSLTKSVTALQQCRSAENVKVLRKLIAEGQKEKQREYRELKDNYNMSDFCQACLLRKKNSAIPCKHGFCSVCLEQMQGKCRVCQANFDVYNVVKN